MPFIAPLFSAARYNRLEIAKILIFAGADPNLKNNITPLHMTTNFIFYKCAQALVKNEADVAIKNKESETPFDIEKAKNVKLLLFSC